MDSLFCVRHWARWNSLALVLALALVGARSLAAETVAALTFAEAPGQVYLPLNEAAALLRWPVERDAKGRCVRLRESAITPGSLRAMTDGAELVSLDDLARAGATVAPAAGDGSIAVSGGNRRFRAAAGAKRVEVNLARQELEAWQGPRLVLRSRISSGRRGCTPAGDFTAGPYKARMHYSRLFDRAPMPWSVQIHRHVFIHGFASVPKYPASHGCIRLPLDEGNPARFFYEWVDLGTPVRVFRGQVVKP